MKRELGQPIMSHYNTIVDDPAEILDGLDKPKRPGEIEIDLQLSIEPLVRVLGLGRKMVSKGRDRLRRGGSESVSRRDPVVSRLRSMIKSPDAGTS